MVSEIFSCIKISISRIIGKSLILFWIYHQIWMLILLIGFNWKSLEINVTIQCVLSLIRLIPTSLRLWKSISRLIRKFNQASKIILHLYFFILVQGPLLLSLNSCIELIHLNFIFNFSHWLIEVYIVLEEVFFLSFRYMGNLCLSLPSSVISDVEIKVSKSIEFCSWIVFLPRGLNLPTITFFNFIIPILNHSNRW